MFRIFPKKKYNILVPKLDKNITQLNAEEAESYFRWYMEQVPGRTDYVSNFCASELHIPREKMDCSPDSLVLLWRWFCQRAKTEKRRITDDTVKNSISDNGTGTVRQLNMESEYIIRDIGMYLGETMRKNNPAIYWTYYTKPRRDFFVNRPLLKGFVDRTTGTPFEAAFEPIHMVHIQATKILKKQARNTDLLNIYNIWMNKI